MNRFYRVAIGKRPVGTATERREPPLEGEVVIKVTDAKTQGNFKVMIVDADDYQHQGNLALRGVEVLSEAEAIELAARYQPETTREERNHRTGNVEIIHEPAVDLKRILSLRAEA